MTYNRVNVYIIKPTSSANKTRVESSIFLLRLSGKSLSYTVKSAERHHLKDWSSDGNKKETPKKISLCFFKRRVKQQKVLCILNAIVEWAH